ncbi:MAG: radical SAM protein [archaeon]
MNEVIRRLRTWAGGHSAPPWGIEIAPTLRCNHRCRFCWRVGADNIDYLEELPLGKYKEIIEDAAKLGVGEFKVIGGGEATVRRDTMGIMKLVKARGMQGYLCTNGTNFTHKQIEDLVGLGWDHIKVSLHGADGKTNDYLTGVNGSFRRAVENIRHFSSRRQKSGKPYLEIGVVLVNRNYGQVPEIISLAKNIGADAVFIEPVTSYSEAGEALRLNPVQQHEFTRIATKAAGLADKYAITTNLRRFFETRLVEKTGSMKEVLSTGRAGFVNMPCFEPFYRMGIRVDGRVGPCGFFDEAATENIRNRTLEQIWYGPYFQKRRQDMLDSSLSDYCRKCCTTLVTNNLEIRKELEK